MRELCRALYLFEARFYADVEATATDRLEAESSDAQPGPERAAPSFLSSLWRTHHLANLPSLLRENTRHSRYIHGLDMASRIFAIASLETGYCSYDDGFNLLFQSESGYSSYVVDMGNCVNECKVIFKYARTSAPWCGGLGGD